MTKSIYEFWLSQQNGKEKLQLPVLPPSLDISGSSKNETIDLAKFGEITILQDPAAKTFTFSSFFPAIWTPLCEVRATKLSLPENYKKRIDIWKESKLPVRFIVTNTDINFAVSIDDFSVKEVGGAIGDLEYTLVLKEYTFVTARKIDTRKKTVPNSGSGGGKKRLDTKQQPKTYTVKRHDTLWALAKVIYKDSSQWPKLWEANKEMLVKRDKRNVTDPGHWIYPGQVLKVP